MLVVSHFLSHTDPNVPHAPNVETFPFFTSEVRYYSRYYGYGRHGLAVGTAYSAESLDIIFTEEDANEMAHSNQNPADLR